MWELQTGQKDLEGMLGKILPVTSCVLQRKHIICVQEWKKKSTGFFFVASREGLEID